MVLKSKFNVFTDTHKYILGNGFIVLPVLMSHACFKSLVLFHSIKQILSTQYFSKFAKLGACRFLRPFIFRNIIKILILLAYSLNINIFFVLSLVQSKDVVCEKKIKQLVDMGFDVVSYL